MKIDIIFPQVRGKALDSIILKRFQAVVLKDNSFLNFSLNL